MVKDNGYLTVGRALFANLVVQAHGTARRNGFYDEPKTDADRIAYMHEELSELLRAFKDGEPESEKLPGVSSSKEEWVDSLIRFFDFAGSKGWDGAELYEILRRKMQYNEGRPRLHGKEIG